MCLKRCTRTKDRKAHTETIRRKRGRQPPPRGPAPRASGEELQITQMDAWRGPMEVLHQDGQHRQLRLFTDGVPAGPHAPDGVAVKRDAFTSSRPAVSAIASLPANSGKRSPCRPSRASSWLRLRRGAVERPGATAGRQPLDTPAGARRNCARTSTGWVRAWQPPC